MAFQTIKRNGQQVLLHNTRPLWVVQYECNDGANWFQAYRAVRPVPKGRAPWTVDNRRIGDIDRGFSSADEAMAAAERYAESKQIEAAA